MSWNYRVLLQDKAFAVHEVYYDQSGQIQSWTEDSVGPSGETLDELKRDLEFFMAALQEPVLRYDSATNRLVELEMEGSVG